MTVNGPLLRDIHLPSAAWWPPAPGWWLLAVLVLLLVAAGVWIAWRRARRRPLLAALREVDQLAAAFTRDRDTAALADGASRLLRRVARKINPAVASADGEAWRAFVHVHAHDARTRAALDALLAARFRAHPLLDAESLLVALRAWCRGALGAKRSVSRRGDARDGRAQAAAT